MLATSSCSAYKKFSQWTLRYQIEVYGGNLTAVGFREARKVGEEMMLRNVAAKSSDVELIPFFWPFAQNQSRK